HREGLGGSERMASADGGARPLRGRQPARHRRTGSARSRRIAPDADGRTMIRPAARRAMRAAAPWAATVMPRFSGPIPLVLIMALASLAIPVAAVTAPPKGAARPPLTNEDVVRLVVYGTKEEVILKESAPRPPAF